MGTVANEHMPMGSHRAVLKKTEESWSLGNQWILINKETILW